jgi:hypothetical protein
MLAVHIENLLFLLFVTIAFLFQLLTRAASRASKDSSEPRRGSTTTPPPLPGGKSDVDEEHIRKFLEALGQPPGAKPPPPVVHRTDIPPRPVAPVQPPPGMRPFAIPSRPLTPDERGKRSVILHEESVGEPGEWQRKINYPAQIPRPTAERKAFLSKLAEPSTFEVHKGPIPIERPAVTKQANQIHAARTQAIPEPLEIELNIAALLRSTSGLRHAIILREIFGPPRSLQPLDLIGV